MTKTSIAALLALALALPAAAVDTPGTDLWVVTSAKVTGAGGEQFVTSLRVVNANAATANVVLKLLGQTTLDSGGNALGDNTAGPTRSVTVPAGQTLAIDDVLASFGASGAGGLHVTSDVPVVVTSQTLVANARSATGVAGTYGFAIPAQTFDNALDVGDTAYVPYVSGAPDGATSGYRTNLFLLSGNAGANTTLHVKLVRGNGTTVGEANYTLGKLSQTQVNRIAAALGSQTADTNMTAVVTVQSGGPVFLGASVIDNAISSILYTPPSKSWRPQNATYGLNIDDGGYGFSGRLNVENGIPDFLTAGLVVDSAASGACSLGTPQLFFVQTASYAPFSNLSVTATGPSSFSFTGSTRNADGSAAATVSGTALFAPDGTVSGQIVYTRASGAGNTCAGVSDTFPFYGTVFGTVGP